MQENSQRVEFTKEMKKTHTILCPNMADLHFRLLEAVLRQEGYRAEVLRLENEDVIEEGLRYIHNDTCYPALVTTGQMMAALKSGKYDLDHVALIMSQTGGGCRASNYIHLIRKALKAAGLEQIPVISLNLAGLEKNSGFKITPKLVIKALACVSYGDALMLLANQTEPYEINKGETKALVDTWIAKISSQFEHNRGYGLGAIRRQLKEMTKDFEAVPIKMAPKIKVGIVGEIFVKYSSLANNELEQFLKDQDCEVHVPGIMNFAMYCIGNGIEDATLYGAVPFKKSLHKIGIKFLEQYEKALLNALEGSRYHAPTPYRELKENVKSFIGTGCKMGEGWLLTAEMVDLTTHGYDNIVCCQPFGCLPNHIAGKGMIKQIHKTYPNANILAVDYDPGSSRVNQENRIKLMLSVAREQLMDKQIVHPISLKKQKQEEENRQIA